jgi:hypothetical protein
MSRRAVIVALLTGCVVLSTYTHRARKAAAGISDVLDGPGRYVDMGVVIKVVRQDLANGDRLLPEAPPLVVLREHRFGGMIDTSADPVGFCGPSIAPVVWFCSERAEEIVLHEPPQPPRRLVYGAMGAGKTTTLAQWLALRMLARTGIQAEIGCTAPTNERTGIIARAIRDLWPRAWWTWRERDKTFTCANEVVVRLVSTHQQSKAEGSRVQGYTWTDHAGDEIQDQLDVDSDIEARGRGAPNGWFARLNTATAKDDPDWRNWRDRLTKLTDLWSVYRMEGVSSPFIDPVHWESMRASMTEREYKRKVLALDVGPERQLYPTWQRRDDNGAPASLRPVPLGAEDVTAQVLAPWGRNMSVLIGHDPGRRQHVSVLLKAYRVPRLCRDRHVWFVVDEVTSRATTVEAHVQDVLSKVRDEYHCNQLDWRGQPSPSGPRALVRLDPYSDSANDERAHRTVASVWRAAGLDAFSAAYTMSQSGAVKSGTIQREARINMITRLLCAADGTRRLFVACDDRAQPVAPRTVESFERSERMESERAEAVKGEHDLSHWTAAVGYALWLLEKPRDHGPLAVSEAR